MNLGGRYIRTLTRSHVCGCNSALAHFVRSFACCWRAHVGRGVGAVTMRESGVVDLESGPLNEHYNKDYELHYNGV